MIQKKVRSHFCRSSSRFLYRKAINKIIVLVRFPPPLFLPSQTLCPLSLIVHQYPFTLQGGERHCETKASLLWKQLNHPARAQPRPPNPESSATPIRLRDLSLRSGHGRWTTKWNHCSLPGISLSVSFPWRGKKACCGDCWTYQCQLRFPTNITQCPANQSFQRKQRGQINLQQRNS